MDNDYKKHFSVMNTDVLNYLQVHFNLDDELLIADLTFGAGGHTIKVLETFKNSRVYAVDQDIDAVKNALDLIKVKGLAERFHLDHTNFENFYKLHSDKSFDAIIMDLGVSSHHFDQQDRGFSFRLNAPLDMRMDATDGSILTASEIINQESEEDLANIIFEYGEERYSRRIAKRIVEQRKSKPILMTKDLEEICYLSYPVNERHKKTHPATKTFQAFRIFVNRELEVLTKSIPKLSDLLSAGGLLMIISFHSLEDRIVKHKFKEIFQSDKNLVKILTKRPDLPSESEIMENPRSRSAKLRVLKKLHPGGSIEQKKVKKQ